MPIDNLDDASLYKAHEAQKKYTAVNNTVLGAALCARNNEEHLFINLGR